MRDIEIAKVKLVDGGDGGVEIEFAEDGPISSHNDKECENPVHEDFRNAVQQLAVHLAILTDYIPEKKSGDMDMIALFTVTGYSIRGEEEKRKFVITGYRSTKRGGTVILNSPPTRFEEDEATAYSLIGDVESKIASIVDQAKQYLFKGKQAPKKQLSLDMPVDEPVTNIKIAQPEKAGNEANDDDDLGDLIDEELIDPDKSKSGMKLQHADPEAMKRVAEMDNEDENPKADKGKGKLKRGSGPKKK